MNYCFFSKSVCFYLQQIKQCIYFLTVIQLKKEKEKVKKKNKLKINKKLKEKQQKTLFLYFF